MDDERAESLGERPLEWRTQVLEAKNLEPGSTNLEPRATNLAPNSTRTWRMDVPGIMAGSREGESAALAKHPSWRFSSILGPKSGHYISSVLPDVAEFGALFGALCQIVGETTVCRPSTPRGGFGPILGL